MKHSKSVIDWLVCKFGGSSVATAENWENIYKIVAQNLALQKQVVVVCSALKGITDVLKSALERASKNASTDLQLAEIKNRHFQLAHALGFDGRALLKQPLESLEKVLKECAKCGNTPPLRARILSFGEILSTHLGAHYLEQKGLPALWWDARDLLAATGPAQGQGAYLRAKCEAAADPNLQEQLSRAGQLHITQGFIVRTSTGETALLGRGGSDCSAAYLAAKLDASRLEIWTDVPGMFTANPHHIPNARIIRKLSYQEAEALAMTGAKVLQPQCIAPAQKNNIPIFIKWTRYPEVPGTEILDVENSEALPGLRALTVRKDVFLMRRDALQPDTWEFLKDIMNQENANHLHLASLSINQHTIETIIDPMLTPFNHRDTLRILRELEQRANVEVETGVSSLSLVGNDTDTLYEDLKVALANLNPGQLRTLGSAGKNHLSLYLDYPHIEEFLGSMHRLLLENHAECQTFGPTWHELSQPNFLPEIGQIS